MPFAVAAAAAGAVVLDEYAASRRSLLLANVGAAAAELDVAAGRATSWAAPTR